MTDLMPLTAFEQESVKSLRIPDVVLHDARMMTDLVVEVAAKGAVDGAEITCPEALLWLGRHLQDKLDLLAALSGDGNAPGWMQPETEE
ncbi:hypothetical protein [Acetobacter senegalensis]|uniref:hypothetical protein n=1 Tax=Acetobacter senegalensis TaxID=446692 RepID=UPI00264BD0C6|nr:hypothetical protein [Acetobacter senegalensis]MDN7355187.1 hypothetical protein [Acetobacter senegalensis]